uniref:GLOBIN domain-containing protein n=1 Tax=Meloidogyne hapla TaxID=6305 RepID=A0A1I8BM18_MELHA
MATKEEIKKSLKIQLNKLVNDESFKFYKSIVNKKESFVETNKRVIKAYGKLFWLKLFMQMFIKLHNDENENKSLISSSLMPRTCLYALAGILGEFEIREKDENDFLFKIWQKFVKGELKNKKQIFKDFDKLLNEMFDYDWLNNCLDDKENEEVSDEEKEGKGEENKDKVIKCVNKIKTKILKAKNNGKN